MTPEIATVIAAAIAVGGVILSAVVSISISGRSNYINSVTTERSKWIDKLRINLAEIIGISGTIQIAFARDSTYARSDKCHDAISRIETILAILRLQLNPRGEIDSNIIILLEAIPRALESGFFRELEELLVGHSQALLKEEWEKVKRESRGDFFSLWNIFCTWQRMRAYRAYASGSGSVAKFRATSN